ncbi:metallophosphoesterase, partial [Pedobacter sp.]|uniref:metallophosphoesterase n=1 Tax=Pedobacter sp. TaxID=1411316 RepID=UPI003D7F4B50
AFLCILCGLGCEKDPPAPQPFFFMQLSDPQFGFYTGNKDFVKETVNFEKAIVAANRLRPAFVIVTGDLVNEAGNAAQLAEYKRIISLLDTNIAIYHVAGNHDLTNMPDSTDIIAFRKQFGPDYYSFKYQNLQGIVLNSLYFKSPGTVQKQADEQDKWLREELKLANSNAMAPLMVFQHYSWFLTDTAESSGYFNININTRKKYLDLFAAHQVSHIFAGHYHRNAFGKFGELEMVTTGPVGRPLGNDPSGLRIIIVRGQQVSHQYYALDSIPQQINLNP